ncbi:MAG: translocation/assembly module TamB domain-containing protein [Cytophagales bacterium]|nr:translocation/assembly module TamB domain-containing protein [Bernardetiaceae bacterium]MDW8209984.1 translocation/assembly module TamB domain-containing protein [Cytophagales bacterium]
MNAILPTDDQPKSTARVTKKRARLVNFFITSFFVIVSLLLFALLVLQFPLVQTWLGRKATAYLTRRTGFEMHIQGISIRWLDQAVLKGVLIKDHTGETMLAASALGVDYDLWTLLQGNDIIFNRIRLDSLAFRLIANGPNEQFNIVTLIDALSGPQSDTTTTSTGKLVIEQIIFNNCLFSYHQPKSDSLAEGFDYNHFTLDQLNGEVKNFSLVQDSISLQARNLSARHPHLNWNINRLNTSFLYCNKGLFFQELDLQTDKSRLGNSFSLSYQAPEAMDHFASQVQINAQLKETTLHTEDLALFAPAVKKWPVALKLSATIEGTLEDLTLNDLYLHLGRESTIKGNFFLEGLPEIEQTLLQLQFKQSQIAPADLKPFLSDEQFALIAPLGKIRFGGQFAGYLNDFVARGHFETDIGSVFADINLKTTPQTYRGQLVVQNLQLGKIVNLPQLGMVDANVNIDGKGFSLDNAEAEVKGRVDRLGLQNYSYKHLQADLRLKKGFAEGYLKINDPHLAFESTGQFNLKDSLIRLHGVLRQADLQKLHWTSKPAILRTAFHCHLNGFDPDNLTGHIRLDSLYFLYDRKDILLDSVTFYSHFKTNNSTLRFYSNLIDLEATGNFTPSLLVKDISTLANEYALYLSNDQLAIENYYSRKLATNKLKPSQQQLEKSYQMHYSIALRNVAPLTQMLLPELQVGPNSLVKGQFSSDQTKDFELSLSSDVLQYGNWIVRDVNASCKTTKVPTANQISATLQLKAAFLHQTDQRSKTDTLLQNIQIRGHWEKDRIGYELSAQAAHSSDHGSLKGDLRFMPQKHYLLTLHPSFAVFNDHRWENTDTAFVDIQGKEIGINNFYFADGQRFISVKGTISENPEAELEIEIKRIGIELLGNLIGQKIEGEAEGKVFLKDLYHQIQADGFVYIQNLKLGDFLLGQLQNKVSWDQEEQLIAMQSALINNQREVLNIQGTYKQADNTVDFNIDLRQTNIAVLESFLTDIASDLAGKAQGQLRIYGQATAPQIAGDLFISGGRFKINYLNTTYFFDDRILFEEDRIAVRRLRLRDEDQNVAFLDGGVYHYGFTNFIIDLRADFRRFKVLNTPPSEEALYYGTAVATGKMTIFGPPNNLQITIDAISERGTRIFMPLDGYASTEEKSFIRFVSLKPDTTTQDSLAAQLQLQRKIDLSKLVIALNLEITPDAQMEIILDRKAGDIIRGNARGKLKMDLDTKGDFTMFGDVEIVRGSYLFTFQNLFSKSFDIKQGSTITWNGDPFKGQMNIVASYTQKVALTPILARAQLDSATLNRPELKRRYPVRVDLFLAGELLRPQISYNIEFFDYPRTIIAGGVPISLETSIAAFKARLASDEQELQKQVFSLLMLRRLLPENAFKGIGQSAGNSLSELIANQLSAWMSQVDENLEVDIDLNGFDANAFNTMQLRLSYSFMNGRVRITRDGSFTNVQNRANISSIAGDWTVEYLLTPDGKMRMKMYRRNIANTFNSTLIGANVTTGASMMYTRSFNNISELFGKKPRKSTKQRNPVIPYRDNYIYLPSEEETEQLP